MVFLYFCEVKKEQKISVYEDCNLFLHKLQIEKLLRLVLTLKKTAAS